MTESQDTLAADELAKAEKELTKWREKITELRKSMPLENVKDYNLKNSDGTTVSLHSLFGDKSDLIVVHNMGKKCPYCTLWADGFMGVYQHLENRAAFVVVFAAVAVPSAGEAAAPAAADPRQETH